MLTPMHVFRAVLVAISATLALQSVFVASTAFTKADAAGLLDGAGCFLLFSIYPVWSIVRSKRRRQPDRVAEQTPL
jgi:hypothetical protein